MSAQPWRVPFLHQAASCARVRPPGRALRGAVALYYRPAHPRLFRTVLYSVLSLVITTCTLHVRTRSVGHAFLRPHPVPASDGISLSAVSASDAQLYCAGPQPAPFWPRAALSLAAAPSRLSDSQPPIRPIFGKCCPVSPRNGPFKIKLHREPPHLPYIKLWTRSLAGIRPTRQLVSPGSNPPSRVFKNS